MATSLMFGIFTVAAQAQAPENQDEITVTALRRAQSVQNAPAAISAFDDEAMERLDIHDTESLVRSVPSLSFVPLAPGESMLALRGLAPSFGLSPTVGVYMDETPFSFRTDRGSGTPNIDLFDVDRVEVLRGPQGTLYGSSSLGGTLRYIMNKPDPSGFEGKAEVGASSMHSGGFGYLAKAALNIPISEIFAVRIVGSYDHSGGYIDRYTPSDLTDPSPNDPISKENYNDTDLYNARISGRLVLDETFSVTPSFTYQKIESNGQLISDTNRGDFGRASSIGDEPSLTELMVANLTIEKEFSFADFVSSTSYMHRDANTVLDYTALMYNFFGLEGGVMDRAPSTTETITQEIRLSSNGDGPFGWTLGGYFSDLDQTITEIIYGQELADYTRSLGGDDPIPGSSEAYNFFQRNTDQQLAGFVEMTYDLTDRLNLVGGVRVSRLKNGVLNQCDESSSIDIFCTPDFPVITATKTDVSPRFSANFQITDDILTYVSAARGFRQGGPNISLIDVPSTPCALSSFYSSVYDPDTVWSYEAGAKTRLIGGKVTANAAVFQLDQKGVQLSVTDPGCYSIFFANAGDAQTRGAELEVSAQLTPAFSFTGRLGFNDAEFTNVPDAFGLAAGYGEGDNVPNVPRWTYGLSGEYRRPVAGAWEAFLRADWSHVGATPFSTDMLNGGGEKRPAYDIINAQIGLSGERYEFVIYARNLFDERAILSIDRGGTTIPGVFESRIYSTPRSIGGTLRASF